MIIYLRKHLTSRQLMKSESLLNGSRLWDILPVDVRAEEDIEMFKKSIKTILFNRNADFKMKAYK